MQINSYLHSHNRVWINKNVFQRNLTNLLTSGIQSSSAVISRLNTDTYTPSCPASQLKASDLSDLSRQNIIRDWEKRKQESGDDLFKLYSSSQHLVFAEKLQEMGFFDGMSEEEKEQVETLLRHITSIMNSVSDHQGGFTDVGNSDSDDIVYYYEGEFITEKREDKAFSKVYSSEAKMDLESSTVALRAFSQKYVDPEHQEEFNSLIDDFHQYNAEYLKTYRAFGEELELRAAQMNGDGTIDRWLAQGGALFDTSDEMGCPNEVPDVSHTEDEANAYWGNLAQIFEMMQKAGANFSDVEDLLKTEYLDYNTGGMNNRYFEKYLQSHGEQVFDHMKGYWSDWRECNLFCVFGFSPYSGGRVWAEPTKPCKYWINQHL